MSGVQNLLPVRWPLTVERALPASDRFTRGGNRRRRQTTNALPTAGQQIIPTRAGEDKLLDRQGLPVDLRGRRHSSAAHYYCCFIPKFKA